MELAPTFLLAAHIHEGSKAFIFPLKSLDATNRPTWLSSLQQAHYADVVRLYEIDPSGAPVIPTVSQKASEKVKPRDWLNLLLRESLGTRLPLAYGLP